MANVLSRTEDYGLRPDASGKVRDIFDLGDHLLIVATDRISAYDAILPTPVPGKGIVLTQMTLGWYEYFGENLKTHFVTADVDGFPGRLKGRSELAGRSMLVRKARRYDVECVVRGYLSGSGWREYREKGSICGIGLPKGLSESARLERPIFTPSTKAETGHDENISFEEMKRLVPPGVADELSRKSLSIYARAREYAETRGIILADTKFEFGDLDGEIILIDELLSPDSSRFWPADSYKPGRAQASFDKQFVRDHLDASGWDHTPPAPPLPDDVVRKTADRYREACERLFPHIKLEKYL
jgi:phosphoribosylaminoimidazole-succinocarboxamide synthase